MSPRIMKVAVPLPKHSAMFGHEASSHTVCSFCARRMSLISWKRELGLAARTRIQEGLGSRVACGTILIVFFAPFSFTPASRIELLDENAAQFQTYLFFCLQKTQVLHLGDLQSRIAARIDRAERREVHVHIEREAVIGAAAHHADAERRDLRAVDVHARGARAALAADEIDHGLFEEPDVALDLDAAPGQVDERVEHDL